jgi:hypothetical protein
LVACFKIRVKFYLFPISSSSPSRLSAVRGLSVQVWFLKEEGGSLSWERQCVVDNSEMDLLVGPLAHSRMLKVHNVTAGVVLVSPG